MPKSDLFDNPVRCIGNILHFMKGHPLRFPKSSRLYLRKEIEILFLSGKNIKEYPVKAIYDFIPLRDSPLKIGVVVPKKLFKKAVDRNRIKRQIREVFRLNSGPFKDFFLSKATTVRVMFIFTGKELPDYVTLQTKIILILQRLQKNYELGAL